MLTLEFVRVRERGETIVPLYINTQDERLLAIAAALIEVYRAHQGKSRQILDETLSSLIEQMEELNFCRGCSKLLEDRAVFDAQSTLNPSEVRQSIFTMAGQAHQQKKFNREQVLAYAAEMMHNTVEQIEAAMFADLKQNQVMQEFNPISPEHLLERYNTSMAQAILLKALSLDVQIKEPNPLRYRQLFRAIKFYRLLHQIQGTAAEGFTITLDGPLSLFQACQKYGIQMALFLPALLLCQNWQLTAHLRWGRNNRLRYFRLTPKDRLTSHYPDTGLYMPPELAAFEERFQKLESLWDISHECDLLSIGKQELCVPDYAFTHRVTHQTVYLEIFGFWRKGALEKRLANLAEYPVSLLLAVSQKLRGEKQSCDVTHQQLYFFHEVLIPKEVEERLNRLAQAPR